jgi:hypothetical protein
LENLRADLAVLQRMLSGRSSERPRPEPAAGGDGGERRDGSGGSGQEAGPRAAAHCRRRYRRACSCRVPATATAPGPPKAVGKGLFSNGLTAMLLTERFAAGRSVNSLVKTPKTLPVAKVFTGAGRRKSSRLENYSRQAAPPGGGAGQPAGFAVTLCATKPDCPAEAELQLPGRRPQLRGLPRRLIVGGVQVIDLPRPPPREPRHLPRGSRPTWSSPFACPAPGNSTSRAECASSALTNF